MIEQPAEGEYDSFYKGYVDSVRDGDIMEILKGQVKAIEMLPSLVEPSLEGYRYAPEKWSIREVVGHLIDAERVFGYRAYCISRGDRTPLPGFDEESYVAHADSDQRSLKSLVEELSTVRTSNLHVFLNLPADSANSIGNANGSPVSVRALAFITAGHLQHHLGVLEARYGVQPDL